MVSIIISIDSLYSIGNCAKFGFLKIRVQALRCTITSNLCSLWSSSSTPRSSRDEQNASIFTIMIYPSLMFSTETTLRDPVFI